MGLLTPLPGEVVDRQTILELKMDAAGKKEISANAFRDEYDQLQAYLEKNSFARAPERQDQEALYKKMKDVNTQLWNIEDEIRLIIKNAGDSSKLSADQKVQVCKISFEIPRLNDRRAELVREINKLFNIDRVEKLYN
jgi:hypothetical protein